MRKTFTLFMAMALAILMVACAPKMKEQESVVRKVIITTPAKIDSISERKFTGIIKENAEVNLAFRVAGPIQKIYVNEGNYVTKGQLIAQIDPRDYEIQLGVAKAQYEQMKAEYDRLTELNKRKSVADNDYEKAVSGEKMLAIQLKHAQDQLNDTKLYAPFSGYIQTVKYHEKELVNTGMAIATLLDMNSYTIDVDLPISFYLEKENFVAFHCLQTQVADSWYPLLLKGYKPKANNNQLYTTCFRLDPKVNSKLAPGMNVLVQVSYKTKIKNPLSVPLQSIFNAQGKTYVWIFNSNTSTVQQREVVTDELVKNGNIRIVSGLSEKDSIVIAGVHLLRNDEKVRLLEPTSETNIGGLL